MWPVIAFYAGRILQIMGIVTTGASLILFGGVDGRMGDMFKLAFAGVAEFYIGYAIIAWSSSKTPP